MRDNRVMHIFRSPSGSAAWSLAARAVGAALAAACLLSTPALAQDGAETTTASPSSHTVYELTQSQIPLGEAGVLIESSDTGYVSTSYVVLHGLIDVSNELVTRPDGTAISYSLSGTSQGSEVSVEVDFTEEGAVLFIDAAGIESSVEIESGGPFYVVDNNFIDGFQILANALKSSGAEQLDVPVIVPQVASVGRAVVRSTGVSKAVVTDDERVDAHEVEVTLKVLNQEIAVDLWLDDAGEIAVMEQAVGAIRFERSRAATAEAAGAARDGDSSADRRETAEEVLERTAACVELSKVEVRSAGALLQGLLSLPTAMDSARGAPTLILLPGSGAVDLRGNAPPLISNAGYEQLANSLGCSGYGVLRIAKLGIPPSTGDPNAVTLDTYAFNTADWLDVLAETPGVDPHRLGVIGHSEGGLIALYGTALGIIEPKAIVLISTPGRPMDVLLREQILASARRGGADDAALEQLGEQFDEVIDAVKTSTGTTLEVTEELADNPVVSLFAFATGLLRSEMAQDPAQLIAEVDVPIVIFQGGKDLQVLPVDGRILSEAAPHALLLELPDLTHNLVDVAGPAVSGLVPAHDAAISRTLVAALASYLNGTLRLAR